MASLESIEILIQANIEQFNKQMSLVQGQLNNLNAVSDKTGKAVGGSLAGGVMKANIVSQILLQTISKVARGLWNLGKEIMLSGTQLTRMRVATNSLGQNVGISVTELDNLRKSLAEANTYGIKAEQVISSLARTGLFEMAKGLEVVDARSGKLTTGLNALVLVMKDLGASAGVDSSVAIESVTDFINRGITSSVQGMVAIGNLGTEYRMYAQTLGKDRAELNATEEAQARMNLVMREGKKAWGTYANSYTTAGKMLGSIRDAVKSIFEELGSTLEPLWASITGGIMEFVQQVRNWLIDNTEVIRAWAVRVAGSLQWMIQQIGALLSRIPKIGKYFNGLANFQVKSAGAGGKQAKSLGGVADSMNKASGSAKDLKKEMRGLAGFDEMTILKEQESSGGGGGGGGLGLPAEDTTQEGGGLLAGIDTAITTFSTEIGEKMQPILEKITEFLKPLVELWNKWVKPLWEGLVAQVIMLGDTLSKSPIGAILKILGQVLMGIVVVAIGVVIAIITMLVRGIEGMVQRFTDGFNFVVEVFAHLIVFVQNIPENIRIMVAKVGEWLNQMRYNFSQSWQKIKDDVERVWGNIKKFFSDTWNGVIDGAKNSWEGIKDAFGSVGTWFKDVFSKAWQGVKDVFSSGGKIFDGIKEGIGSAFKMVVNTLIRGINTIITVPFNSINNIIRLLRSIDIMGLQPFKNFSTFTVPQIPQLAQGGVVQSPTLAMVGEAGREVVMPLDRDTGWIEELAGKINANGGNMNLVVKIGEDKIYDKVIDYINDKSFRNQSNFLRI